MKQNNRRKSNKHLITCIQGKDLEKLSNPPNETVTLNNIFNIRKKMLEAVVWGLKREEGN